MNVKLQERRNEALKWELLRQGGSQDKLEGIAKEVGIPQATAARDGARLYPTWYTPLTPLFSVPFMPIFCSIENTISRFRRIYTRSCSYSPCEITAPNHPQLTPFRRSCIDPPTATYQLRIASDTVIDCYYIRGGHVEVDQASPEVIKNS